MGMPEIIVAFKKQAEQIANLRGTVCIIVKETETKYKEYRKTKDIKENDFKPENIKYIKMTMEDKVGKCIVVGAVDVDTAIGIIKEKKFRYLAMPQAEEGDITKLVAFNKKRRTETSKKFKFVAANQKADYEGVINWTGEDTIRKDGTAVTAQEYTCKIAGVLAGLPVNQSATYYVLDDLKSCTNKEDADTCVNNGEIFCVDDGEKIKLSRAVNSKTTLKQDESKELKKIKIVDGMDILEDTITTNFEDYYVGKVDNTYDNKMLYYSAVTNKLFKDLAKKGILAKDYENICEMDYESQRDYLEKESIDTEEMEEMDIRKYPTDTKVFAMARVRFIDCMEDLYLNVAM